MQINYTIASCGLGRMLVGATEVGISALYLGEVDTELEKALRREYPHAATKRVDAELGEWIAQLVDHIDGTQPHIDLPVDVPATAFQRRVWQHLQAIPYGTTTTYKKIAQALGRPAAARAVGLACATNPVSVVIPCHRVLRGDGGLGGYRWGLERKQALLDRERKVASAEPVADQKLPPGAIGTG